MTMIESAASSWKTRIKNAAHSIGAYHIVIVVKFNQFIIIRISVLFI